VGSGYGLGDAELSEDAGFVYQFAMTDPLEPAVVLEEFREIKQVGHSEGAVSCSGSELGRLSRCFSRQTVRIVRQTREIYHALVPVSSGRSSQTT
jgi:hypothetical protein